MYNIVITKKPAGLFCCKKNKNIVYFIKNNVRRNIWITVLQDVNLCWARKLF